MKTKTKGGRPAGPKARIAANHESREALAKTPVKDAAPSHDWGGVRVHRYEVGSLIADDKAEVFNRWHEARRAVMRACNIYVQAWYNWHWRNGSVEKLDAQLTEFKAWEASDPKERGPKPKWTVPSMPPTGDSTLYTAISSRLPILTKDTVSTLCQVWRGNLLNGKDAAGKMKKWIAVLLGLENIATTSSDCIIPIKPGSFQLRTKDGKYFACVTTSRADVPGKKTGIQFRDEFQLRLPKRQGGSHVILERCISGEYNPRNASLMYHEGKRKWFLLVAYQRPAEVVEAGDPDNAAVLRACEDHPWELEIAGRTIWIGGDGRYVGSARRRIFGQRLSRQSNYRNAGSANKGHGRKRALAPIKKLERAWKDFVKTCNHNVTKRVVDLAVEHGCGTIRYEQPSGELRDTLYLGSAGKDGLRTQTFWDWFQVGTLLSYKAQQNGIHVIVSKVEAEVLEEVGA